MQESCWILRALHCLSKVPLVHAACAQGVHCQDSAKLMAASSFPAWPCGSLQCQVAPTRLWRSLGRAAGSEPKPTVGSSHLPPPLPHSQSRGSEVSPASPECMQQWGAGLPCPSCSRQAVWGRAQALDHCNSHHLLPGVGGCEPWPRSPVSWPYRNKLAEGTEFLQKDFCVLIPTCTRIICSSCCLVEVEAGRVCKYTSREKTCSVVKSVIC